MQLAGRVSAGDRVCSTPPKRSRTPITKSGHQVNQRARHPHQHAGGRLILERGQIPESRPLGVIRIKRLIGKCQPGGQQRVLHVGQDQVRDQQPGRPASAGSGYGRMTGYQNKSAVAEETDVLHDSAKPSERRASS